MLLRAVPRSWRGQIDDAISALTSDRRAVSIALLLSAAATACVMAAFVVASRVTGSRADVVTVCAVAPVVLVVNALPLSPSGLGVAETAASITFGQLGVGEGATMMALFRLWTFALCVPGAIFYLVWSRRLAARGGGAEPAAPGR